MLPPAGSALLTGASDGGIIGAFGGPSTWPDADGDGVIGLLDCDDADATVLPGVPEVPVNGVDDNCDGIELCHVDTDLDGYGEPALLPSTDADCADPGESPDALESCPDEDDGLDGDADGVPDGCDVCPGFPEVPDTDGDGVADGCDPCPLDVPDDTDGDGLCDSSDPCPTGACSTGDTGSTSTGTTADTGSSAATGDTATAETADTSVPEPVAAARAGVAPLGAVGPAGCGCSSGGAGPWLVVLGLARRRRR
jgi:hypothetical protein